MVRGVEVGTSLWVKPSRLFAAMGFYFTVAKWRTAAWRWREEESSSCPQPLHKGRETVYPQQPQRNPSTCVCTLVTSWEGACGQQNSSL